MDFEIIDFHAHPYYDFGKVSQTEKEFIEGQQKHGVSRVCGSVIYKDMNKRPLPEYETLVPHLNDTAFDFAQKSGGYVYPGIHVHPGFVDMSCLELERAKSKGYRLVGELVYYMMEYRKYATKSFIEIMEYARELGMVVNMHPTDPEDMFALCEALPGLTIVWAHLSGYGWLEAETEMMKKYENVFFDISAHGCDKEGMIRRTIDAVGADRILYGTDYPGYDPAPYIEGVMRECNNDAEREKIFSLNAKRLLGLA